MTTLRNCPECGDLIHGRSDKRYCSDICRNSFHNRNRIERHDTIREVNQILFRNRRILLDCMNNRREVVPENYLTVRGYNFNFFTHKVDQQDGDAMFCYDVGIVQQQDGQILLTKACYPY